MNQNDTNLSERNEIAQDQLLSAVLKKLGADPSGNISPPLQNTANDQNATAAIGGSGDILSALLSNPELIAKLPTIISSIKPIIEMLGKSNSVTSETVSANALPAKSDPAKPVSAPSSRTQSSRTDLLCAMKPYLSEDRRNAIDYIVKLGRLGDILKTL
jgi:hypothetical protein